MSPRSPRFASWLPTVLAAVALAAGCAPLGEAEGAPGRGGRGAEPGGAGGEPVESSVRAPDGRQNEEGTVHDDSRWAEIDRLVAAQRYEAASEIAVELLEAAREAGDESSWTRALVRLTQLRVALHGYERAVRFLRSTPWPEGAFERLVLELFYAHVLVEYADAYSWEIAQRERVATAGEAEIDEWTGEQIAAEIHRAFARVWRRRGEWGDGPLGAMAAYLDQNDYPPRIRGTLRDAVTYLWVELLGNTSRWRPEQASEVWRLDLEGLVDGGPEAVDVEDTDLHPLLRLAAITADLERWHLQAERPEAAFEARRVRLDRLAASFDGAADRERLRTALGSALEELGRRFPWWAMGRADLAEMTRGESGPDALVRARALALEAAEAFPDSVGGRRCRSIVASIEAPEFGLQTMASDALERRSIGVEHRNLDELHFRAWRLDLFERLESADDYNLLPGQREVDALLASRAPDAAWTVELPATSDYREHRTWVTPPLDRPGLWVVAASARRDFRAEGNRAGAVPLIVGDLVLLSERPRPDVVEAAVRSGASGVAAAGVGVELWRYDWRRGHSRVDRRTTGADGRVRFEGRRGSDSYFLAASSGEEVALDESAFGLGRRERPGDRRAALVYTDRAVYRPLQRVAWKVVAYRGERQAGRFAVEPGARLTVELFDPNGESVATAGVAANRFGSASGAFELPAGRPLGGWTIRVGQRGAASIQVEEYKRPTFEVEIGDPPASLRLNREAVLAAGARFYFGLPVAGGEAAWRVEREPLWRHGRMAYFRPTPMPAELVASGVETVGAEGEIEIRFTPEADERRADSGLSYRYRLTVDVTDPGGETRSASRAFRVGFVTVEGRVRFERGFLHAGETATVEIARADLDGVPRPGAGSVRLVRLQPPPRTLLPAELPVPRPPGAEEYETTPGDLQRPRWQTDYAPDEVLASWPAGGEIVGPTAVEHAADGLAEVALPALEPGAYRLVYTTHDELGVPSETRRELLAVAAGVERLPLAAVLEAERDVVEPGGTARLLVHSGLDDQDLLLELYRDGRRIERLELAAGAGPHLVERPIGLEDRGGLAVRLTTLRDHQLLVAERRIAVPWVDRRLELEFSTFRDRLTPGARERFTVTVRGGDGAALGEGAAELLAYMYDRSLDLFAEHQPPEPLALYPSRGSAAPASSSLGSRVEVWRHGRGLAEVPAPPQLRPDRLRFLDGYPIGGPGGRGRMFRTMAASPMAFNDQVELQESEVAASGLGGDPESDTAAADAPPADAPPPDRPADGLPPDALRTDFAETAFWEPHLVLGEEGSASFEFTVPDSLTEWSLWVHALTADFRAGSRMERARSAKRLMVRPYLPRFLREGDRAEVRVAVQNATDEELRGRVDFDVVDPETDESLLAEFGLDRDAASGVSFTAPAGSGDTLVFALAAPARVGQVAVRVTARAGDLSDGELRPLPLLPGRLHLAQSRFAALHGRDRRQLEFADLAAADDPSLATERLVVTLDAQLFYGVLRALPYLVTFPYECTEQTLNRFLSTGIVSRVYDDYPAVARMAAELSERETPLEIWAGADPNRKMALEETPWLRPARGGKVAPEAELANVLDARVAAAERAAALAELERAQTSAGGFPWWPGGPPSPYLTLYILEGFSRALEFGVEVPRPMVVRAWAYAHRHWIDVLVRQAIAEGCCAETVTYLNYVLSSYPDTAWTGGVFSDDDRRRMLDFSFERWTELAPRSKIQLALTLRRSGRGDDARHVFASVLDSARTDPDLGTYWAPEERAWLWYNDTIETHAAALRALTEIDPGNGLRHGLVQWLFLNKKLNHWKSTRATAEVVYSLVHYLDAEELLGVAETATVRLGPLARRFDFEPDRFGPRVPHGETVGEPVAGLEGAPDAGRPNQLVVPGEAVDPATMSTVVVDKETPGLLFASATWHFATDRLPAEARGDLFSVERRYFRRRLDGDGWALEPLAEGASLAVGDQVEVWLEIASRHAAEYVHLRDPRGAGFEPESTASGYRWDLGLSRYEEIRDSGTNFFMEWLPAGTYTLKYRLRAAHAGAFRVGPATLQSMYAPEFTAYSAGARLEIAE